VLYWQHLGAPSMVQHRWSLVQHVVSPRYEQTISSDAQRRARGAPAVAPASPVRGAQYEPPSSSSHRDVIGQQIACVPPRQYW